MGVNVHSASGVERGTDLLDTNGLSTESLNQFGHFLSR